MNDLFLFYLLLFLSLCGLALSFTACTLRRALSFITVFLVSSTGFFALLKLPVLGGIYFCAGLLLCAAVFASLTFFEDEEDLSHKYNDTALSALLAVSCLVSLLVYITKTLPQAFGIKESELLVFSSFGFFPLLLALFCVFAASAAVFSGREGDL